jgi:hypothetical protein
MGVRWLKIALVLLTLIHTQVGCEVDLSLAIDGRNPPRFSLAGSGNLISFGVMEVPPENQRQSIQRSSDANKLLWKIRPAGGAESKIRRLPPVTYGVVPDGFEQVFPADGSAPVGLEEGKIYEAIGTAYDANGGLMWFRIDGRESRPVPTP